MRYRLTLQAVLIAAAAILVFAVPAGAAFDAEFLTVDPGSPVEGNPKGDVTIVAFLDYNCPFCKQSAPDLERIVKEDGNIRVIYKDWPILSDSSIYGAKLALAAKYQGRYLTVHNALMAIRGGNASTDRMLQAIRDSGIDMQRLGADLIAHKSDIDDLLQRNMGLADSLGLEGTPVFFIGNYRASTLTYDEFKKAVATVRRERKAK